MNLVLRVSVNSIYYIELIIARDWQKVSRYLFSFHELY